VIEAGAALKSLLFGATVAGTVGPIALLIMRYGANAGLRIALLAGCGAALADLCYALVAFVAGQWAVRLLVAHGSQLRVVSSIVLLAIGFRMLMAALRPSPVAVSEAPAVAEHPLRVVFTLTLLNPLTVVTFAGFAAQLPAATSSMAAVGYSFCLFIGSLGVQWLFAAGGAALQRTGWQRAINLASATGVTSFAIAGLLRI
jgi:threonine/homoserine/homoserine lactone efflux protein